MPWQSDVGEIEAAPVKRGDDQCTDTAENNSIPAINSVSRRSFTASLLSYQRELIETGD